MSKPNFTPIAITSSHNLGASIPTNLQNGDFSSDLQHWKQGHGSNVTDKWGVRIIPEDGQFTNVLELWRTDSERDGGTVWIEQQLEVDVSEFSSVRVKAEIKVIQYTLNGSGWWSDIHNREGEYPLRISVYYNDQQDNTYLWAWGFLTSQNPNELTNYDLVNESEWHTFISYNLLDLKPRPKTIISLSVAGAGWDYHSRINSVELITECVLHPEIDTTS